MNLYGRLFWLLFKCFFTKRKLSLMSPARTRFRVWPHDLDLNMHMNNGRYLTLMDLARLDHLRQTCLLGPTIRRKWRPILGDTQMSYFRPLKLFQSYDIESKIEYWDNKWFIMSQTFMRRGAVMARGRVRGLIRGPKGNIAPEALLQVDALHTQAPLQSPAPDHNITAWISELNQLREQTSRMNAHNRSHSS